MSLDIGRLLGFERLCAPNSSGRGPARRPFENAKSARRGKTSLSELAARAVPRSADYCLWQLRVRFGPPAPGRPRAARQRRRRRAAPGRQIRHRGFELGLRPPDRRSSSAWCSFSSSASVVCQSMHGSVIDRPYSSLLKSFGMGWLPAFKWLSSISPTMERLPSTICATQFSATMGCRLGSLFELPWLQSTTMVAGKPAAVSSRSATAMLTAS